jgi:hypothetical protein
MNQCRKMWSLAIILVVLLARYMYLASQFLTPSSEDKKIFLVRHDHTTEERNEQLEKAIVHITNDAAILNQRLRLEFVHITKTGGSSIEMAGAAASILWGACHHRKLEYLGCISPDKPHSAHGVLNSSFRRACAWHIPPRYLRKNNTYTGAATFTVVRDPYSRALSEYYCPWSGNKEEAGRNEAAVMNQWVQELITRSRPSQPVERFLPQSIYVYDKDDVTQIIDHVLFYETMQQEFPALMQQYGLNVTLLDHRANTPHGAKLLTKYNLTNETIVLINNYAKRDFEHFGYAMVGSANEMLAVNMQVRASERSPQHVAQ